MADHTLVDREIRVVLQSGQLLRPWAEESINGASYDIRMGRLLVQAATNDPRGYQARDIAIEKSFFMESGQIVVIESLEELQFPQNMKGYLSLRNTLSSKMLFFTSGKVHPGHKGFLYFPLINLGDERLELHYGQPLVALEFIELDPPAQKIGPDFSTVPKDLMPNLRPRPPFNLLFTRVDDLSSKFARYELVSNLNALVVGSVIVAVIAGIIAGVAVQLVASFSDSDTVTTSSLGKSAAFSAGAIVFGIAALFILALFSWLAWWLFGSARRYINRRGNRGRSAGR